MIALTLDLAINVSFNPTRSLIADVTPEGEARTKGFTWMQTVSGFWGVAAYFIGATLGNEVLISVGMVIVLLFSIIPTCFVSEPRSLEAAHEQSAGPATSDQSQIWRIYFAHAFSWIGVQTMFVYIIAFIQQRLIAVDTSAADSATQSGRIISIAFLVLNAVGFLLPGPVFGPLAGIFGQVIVGLVSDKVWFWGGRRRPFIFVGGTLAALMLFLLPRIGGVNAAIGGLLGANSLLIVATLVALTLDLAINVSFNPTRSLIADVTPEGEARTKGFTCLLYTSDAADE